MVTYNRNISLRLILLQTFFCATTFFCIYFFKTDRSDYGYLFAVLLFFCPVIPVTGLTISKNLLTVKQYYFFGLIPRSLTILKGDEFEIVPFDIELSDVGYMHTEEWYDVFLTFLPTHKAKLQRYILKHTDSSGKRRQVKAKLTGKEHELIVAFAK